MTQPQGQFSSIFDSFTAPGESGKRPKLPKQIMQFELSLDVLHKDNRAKITERFPDKESFLVRISSPSSLQEMDATRAAKGDTLLYVQYLMRDCIVSVDDEPLDTPKREFFWELIGSQGRNILTMQFAPMVSPSDDAMGKADETRRME